MSHRPFAGILSLVAVLLACLGGRAADAMPSFEQWRAACAALPSNRELGGRLPPKELLPLKTFAEMDRVIDAFFAAMTNGPLATGENWIGAGPKADTFLNVERSWFTKPEIPFEPFVQRLALPAGAKVFIQGDLHGDVRSLVAVLGRLNERKMLDGFAISDPDLHIVFLGDYTDRGVYGVEVIYTLLRLRLANPGRVHFVRGNHEDVNLASRYGFLSEGRAKYGRDFNAAKVLRTYDFLPVALFLGNGSDFLQLCHGGMEPGFDPAGLLSASGTNRFQLLGELKQAAYLRAHPDWLKAEPRAASEAREYLRDFKPESPVSPTTLGFMWNDFTVFADEAAFANNPDRAFIYGRPAVEYLLRNAGRDGAKVHAVIRAHQHSGIPNPMMRRLVASRGAFRHWQEKESAEAQSADPSMLVGKIEAGQSRPIPEGSVWTMNVAPDSVYGQANHYSFATYGMLTISTNFADWRITVDTVNVPGI